MGSLKPGFINLTYMCKNLPKDREAGSRQNHRPDWSSMFQYWKQRLPSCLTYNQQPITQHYISYSLTRDE